MRRATGIRACASTLAALLTACASELAFDPAYLPGDRPGYVADGRILIVLPDEQREFVYEGSPDSRVGDFTRLTVPMGRIVEDIANSVFTSCFAAGVEFADRRVPDGDYVIALEGNLRDFAFRYEQVIERGFAAGEEDVWIAPEVDVAFDVRAYDRGGRLVLDRVYESGVMQGERYRTTLRPAERINETLHATLHALMVRVAEDLRPLIAGECTITDRA